MRLSDCFIELISYVLYFKKTVDKRQPAYDQVRAEIDRLLQSSRDGVGYGGITEEDYDAGRFAVCAWIDETIMNSPWTHRQLWLKEPLQRIHYQTTNAGELFFDRLNALGPHQKDAREVYYLCLAMGFTGRYCNEGDKFLIDQLKASNLKVLTGSSLGIPSLEKGELFPEGYPADAGPAPEMKAPSGFPLFNIVAASIPVALFAVLFFIYRFVLSNITETLFKAVQ
ncbi:MAG TPA: DotU family type IV/VI secretion system protein [Deltaproteobacteria bacterium]|jgi:type VI secretion system protein ImpK|nr:DotU family type IV/VI secretion system protein [Deltaproteobacteria bacterium]HQI00650.1 DotU family type IV/VI secretion system protein [Deltaproteobacteria bacterium]